MIPIRRLGLGGSLIPLLSYDEADELSYNLEQLDIEGEWFEVIYLHYLDERALVAHFKDKQLVGFVYPETEKESETPD